MLSHALTEDGIWRTVSGSGCGHGRMGTAQNRIGEERWKNHILHLLHWSGGLSVVWSWIKQNTDENITSFATVVKERSKTTGLDLRVGHVANVGIEMQPGRIAAGSRVNPPTNQNSERHLAGCARADICMVTSIWVAMSTHVMAIAQGQPLHVVTFA